MKDFIPIRIWKDEQSDILNIGGFAIREGAISCVYIMYKFNNEKRKLSYAYANAQNPQSL